MALLHSVTFHMKRCLQPIPSLKSAEVRSIPNTRYHRYQGTLKRIDTLDWYRLLRSYVPGCAIDNLQDELTCIFYAMKIF